MLLELPVAGPVPQLRINGIVDGLRKEMPSIASVPMKYLDGRGEFDQIGDVGRRQRTGEHLAELPDEP